jgi:hypothetical protein
MVGNGRGAAGADILLAIALAELTTAAGAELVGQVAWAGRDKVDDIPAFAEPISPGETAAVRNPALGTAFDG